MFHSSVSTNPLPITNPQNLKKYFKNKLNRIKPAQNSKKLKNNFKNKPNQKTKKIQKPKKGETNMPIVIIDKPQKTVQPKPKKKSARKKPIVVEAQPLVEQPTASTSTEPLCPSCNSHLDYNALTDNYRCPVCGYIAEPNEVN